MSRPPRKPVESLIDIDEALSRIFSLNIVGPPETEYVDTINSYGRVLAEDIVSPVDLPRFRISLMDGYAARYIDLVSDIRKRLRVSGRIRIGDDASGIQIDPGTCVEVDTGAMLPRNADIVVPVELVDVEGDGYIVVREVPPPGAHIAYPGSDIARGEVVAGKGSVVDARLVSTLLSLGVSRVKVYRKPRICLLATGRELLEIGEPYRPGKIYESNIGGLSRYLADMGFDVHVAGVVGDDLEAISSRLLDLSRRCDAIITTGGTSAGAEDYVYRAVERDGRIIVRGIRYKPGKPLLVGVVGGKLVIGLPGNPVSAFFTLTQILRDVLYRMLGRREHLQDMELKARLLLRARGARGRVTHVPSILVRGPDGVLRVLPWVFESYMVGRLAFADTYITIPLSFEGGSLEYGESVGVRFLRYPPRVWRLRSGEFIDTRFDFGGGVLDLYMDSFTTYRWLLDKAVFEGYLCSEFSIAYMGSSESYRFGFDLDSIPDQYKIDRVKKEITLIYREDLDERDIISVASTPKDTCSRKATESILNTLLQGIASEAKIKRILVTSYRQIASLIMSGDLDIALMPKHLTEDYGRLPDLYRADTVGVLTGYRATTDLI